MSSLRSCSSPHKRSAARQSEERKDVPAKRHKARSTSPPDDPPPLTTTSQHKTNTIRALDIILLEKYIENAIQKVRTSLKPFLKDKDYPVSVIRKLDIKIRERIHLAIRDKVIDSDKEVFRLYSAMYTISSDLELLRSVLHEYDEIIKRQAKVNKISKKAKLTDTKPLPYSDDMANSLSNESIFTNVKSLADEVMIQAAQRQILTELYEANNNIQNVPKSCIDEFTEMIRSTLNSLDKRVSDWHWTKIYELYRRDYSMESDEQQLLDICKEQGFKIPRSSRPSEHLYLDIKPPKPIISATNIIVNDLKMSVDRSGEWEWMNRRWKMACVDVNSSITCLFKHYMGCIIKRMVGDKYFTIKPNTRTNVLVLTYRQYRIVDDDIQLFQKFENDFIERTKRDTSSKELVSELHFWQNDNLTSYCFFDMMKITLSKIIGHVLLQFQDASLYHINYLIYEIRSELMTLKYMRNENKCPLTYSEILVEFQNYSESKLNFYIERYMCIKTNIADSNNTIEEKKPVNSYYNPKHEGLRQVVCKMLKEKLDSIFDKGMKIHKEGLKSENEDIKTPKEPVTADEMQSGASGYGNNTIYGPVTGKRERHAESQVENILNTSIINEMTQFKNIKMEQTAIHGNHNSSQSQAGSIVEGIPTKSAVTKQILCTENSRTISPGGTETSRIGMIKLEPMHKDKQTKDANEPSILNDEIASNIKYQAIKENMTETVKRENIITNIKSEPMVGNDEIEGDIFLQVQEMTSNIKHEQMTQDGKKNDTLLPFSSARDVNEPGILNREFALNIMCKPTNQCENMTETEKQDNIVTNIKSEPIAEDDEMEGDIFLPMQEMASSIEHEQITQDKNVAEIVRQENVEYGKKDDTPLPFSSARNVNEPSILNQEIALSKPTNQCENMTETQKQDNIVTNIKSEPIAEDDEMEGDIFLPMQEVTSNLKDEQIPQDKNMAEIVRQENVEYGKKDDTPLPFSSARNVNEPSILNQEIALSKPTNQCENMTETQKQDNIVTNIKSEPIAEDDEMEGDIFLPMQEVTSNLKDEQIPQDKNMAEIVRQENVEYGKKDDTPLSFSSARNVNEPSILNQEIALSKPTSQCENMTETQKHDNIVTNIKSEPIVEDSEMENDIFLPTESQTVNQVMSLNIKHELINQDGNVTDTFEQNNFKHEIKNDILPLSSVGEINTHEECLPSTHNKSTSIKTEIINPDDKITQDISIERNGTNAHNTMELLNTFCTKVERELEPEGNCLSTLKEESVSTEDQKNVAVGNVDAVASISQMLSCNTNMTSGEEETWKTKSYSSLETVIHNIVDEYLSSAIPDLKEKLISTMLKDNTLLNNFDKELQKTNSQLIRLTGEPRLPSLVTLLQFLKQFNIESIKMRKNFHHTIYVLTIDWSKLLEIGEVDMDGNKLFIEKEIYCKQLVDIYIDPDAIFLIKSIDKWNKELVDQASQTHTRLVVRKHKPTAANGDGPVENVPLTTNSDTVIDLTDRTEALVEPTKNNITGIGNATTKKKKRKKNKRMRKAKIYIDEDEEEMEQLPGYPTEYNEITHEVNIEDDFDKVINDLDPEVESFLTTIKETANLPESESTTPK